jgi:hypothetical protein
MCGMLVAGAFAFAGSGAGRAETLADALAGAQGRDPAVTGARAQADATRERIGVVRAAGAPTLGVGGTANTQYAEVNGGSARQIEGGSGAINLNVPLYRPQVGAAVEQAGVASRSAGVQVDAAEQDLLLRTSVAYLEVLAAIETLQAIGAQKTALVTQLASARRSFDVGTATIVDPNEAQARLDLVLAQEINARADLSVGRAARAPIGGRVQVTFELASTARRVQPLLVDLRVMYADARGEPTRVKVFKLSTVELAGGEVAAYAKTLSLAQLSTRIHYPGVHRVAAMVNGVAIEVGDFEVVA